MFRIKLVGCQSAGLGAGLFVSLYTMDPGIGGTLISTQVTDASGIVTFTVTAAGTFWVVTDPLLPRLNALSKPITVVCGQLVNFALPVAENYLCAFGCNLPIKQQLIWNAFCGAPPRVCEIASGPLELVWNGSIYLWIDRGGLPNEITVDAGGIMHIFALNGSESGECFISPQSPISVICPNPTFKASYNGDWGGAPGGGSFTTCDCLWCTMTLTEAP